MKGKIKTLKEEFGFIEQQGKEDVFFHAEAVEMMKFHELRKGMEVEFEAVPGKKGLKAQYVRPVGITEQTEPARRQERHTQQTRLSSQTSTDYRFLNPYNFVRFLEHGQDTEETKILGHCPPPPHDRYVGITGRITCRLNTVTPLFISDSEGITGSKGITGDEHKSYRFFQVDGKYALPNTSLRGMVRNVFEAATNSCMTILEGARQSYHLDSKLSPWLVPARVERNGDAWQLRLLTGTTSLAIGDSPQGTQYAAWAFNYWPMRPSKTLLQDPPANRRVKNFQARAEEGNEVILGEIQHGDGCYALLYETQHPHPRIKFWDVIELAKDRKKLEDRLSAGCRIEKGWLCILNQNIEPKHSERFFFRAKNNTGHPETIELPAQVRQQYEDLIVDYQQRHQKDVKARQEHNEPLDMPVVDDPALSRFVYTHSESKLQGGELVYAMLEGSQTRPQVKFIVPVSVPRVAYEKAIADLLPQHLVSCQKYTFLCPACRTFGWVHPKPPDDLTVSAAYAGRLRFSHGELQGEPKKLPSSIILSILSSPKPTTTSFYLLNRGEPDFNVDYDTPGAQLRGRKCYRHHGRANPDECQRPEGKTDGQNRTMRDVLDKGNQFTFTVQFENLAPLELGALLWALELSGKDNKGQEYQLCHRLGFAKPLGFGSVQITVENLEILNLQKHYTSLVPAWYQVDREIWQKECVRAFQNATCKRYGKQSFYELENIQDLQALLSEPAIDHIHYPRPPYENGKDRTKPDPEGKQYEWFMGNKKTKYPLPLATDDTEGFPLLDHKGQEG